jgi:hypothetical protein
VSVIGYLALEPFSASTSDIMKLYLEVNARIFLLHFLRDKKFRARGMIYLYSELDRSFFYLRIPNDGGRANFEAVPLTTHLISSEAVAEVRHLCIATCTSTTSRYLTGPLTTNFIINNPAYNFSSRKGLLDD